MKRKVVSNTPSIVVFRRIFLLFFRDYRRRLMSAVSRIKLKYTGNAQQNAPLLRYYEFREDQEGDF